MKQLSPSPHCWPGRSAAACILVVALTPACDGGEVEGADESAARTVLTTTRPTAPELCTEPPASDPSIDTLSAALPPEATSGLSQLGTLGSQVDFRGAPSRRGNLVRIQTSLEDDDPTASRTTLQKQSGALSLSIQRAPATQRQVAGKVVLSSANRPLAEVELVTTYAVEATRSGPQLSVQKLQLIDRSTGDQVDVFDPELNITNAPHTCQEEAIVRFGPFPPGMPTVKFPQILDCAGEQCVQVALSWLRLHHNVWRTEQMFAVMDSVNSAQRSYAWGRPGTDANDNAVDLRSSPAYWFGAYAGDHYSAIKGVIGKFGAATRSAKIGPTKLRLQCPVYAENPGNVCFNSSVLGHHWVRGYVNICDSAFTEPTSGAYSVTAVDEVMHHEPLHHIFADFHGKKLLHDIFLHGHGNTCTSGVKWGPVYREPMIRHFVDQGGACHHHEDLVSMVDAYAVFIDSVGQMVRNGAMTHWPKWGDPTPQPPACVGDVGCLCEPTQFNDEPDGDYAIDRHCEDNEGLTVCMKTKFNASDTVGICTLCDEHRGPGCPCNDLSLPCEQGFCFGDDTHGNAAGTGTCYADPPPYFGCLADCEGLLGNGAFCMHDHPDGGRCVPYGTSLPEASNCWWNGGHMDPQELSCTTQPECGNAQDCSDLGYPPYFYCDANLRCMPNP